MPTRLRELSSIKGTFDIVHTKSIQCQDYFLPYSLVAATTESLPEEGDVYRTVTFIPFEFKINSITLQVNQSCDNVSKVSVQLCKQLFVFTVTPNKTTLNIVLTKPILLTRDAYENIEIENMTNDDGDVSACSVILNGFVKM